MMNEMVFLTEINQGYTHKLGPDVVEWDLEFHDDAKKWRAIGKRGGWWKCRSGKDASDVEKQCSLCHSDEKKEAAVSVVLGC